MAPLILKQVDLCLEKGEDLYDELQKLRYDREQYLFYKIMKKLALRV